MELNLCPSCDAFVRSNWTNCRACGNELAPNGQAFEEVGATVGPVATEFAAQPPSETPAPLAPEPEAPAPATFESPAPAPAPDFPPPVYSEDPQPQPAPEPTPEPWDDQPSQAWGSVPTWAEISSVQEPVQEPATQPAPAEPVFQSPEAPAPVQGEGLTWEPPGATTSTPMTPPATPHDAWANDAMLQPIQISYGAPQTPQPAPAPVTAPATAPAATQALFAPSAPNAPVTPDGRLRPALSQGQIIGMAAGGLVLPVITIFVLIAIIGFLGTTSSSQDKLVPVKGTPTTQLHAQSSPTTSAPQWVDYRSPDGLFTIQFPAQPSVTNQIVGGDKISIYSVPIDNNNGLIQVATEDVPQGTLSAVLLQRMQDDAGVLNATLTSHSLTTQNSRLTISATMTTAQGNAINAIAFVQGQTMYTLLVVSGDSSGDPALFGHLSSTLVPASS